MKNEKLKEFFHFLSENRYPNLPEDFSVSINNDDEFSFRVFLYPSRSCNFWTGSDLHYVFSLCEVLDLSCTIWARNGAPVVKIWFIDSKWLQQ